jgi:hypothetical protein
MPNLVSPSCANVRLSLEFLFGAWAGRLLLKATANNHGSDATIVGAAIILEELIRCPQAIAQ